METPQPVIKKKFYKRTWFWILVGVIFFVIIGSSGSQPAPATSSNVQASNPAPSTPKTDQQLLDEKLSNAASSVSITKVSYSTTKVEKSDPDRPQDTKMITVDFKVSEFYNKSSLLRDTGKVSAQTFQAIYTSNLKPYDVFVNFLGTVTDRYGNKKEEAIMVYHINKAVYDKINWQNFDQTKTCDFLKSEQKVAGFSEVSCNTLANIE